MTFNNIILEININNKKSETMTQDITNSDLEYKDHKHKFIAELENLFKTWGFANIKKLWLTKYSLVIDYFDSTQKNIWIKPSLTIEEILKQVILQGGLK